MTTLDELRLRVVPGEGVVLRVAGVTAVAFPAGEQHQALVTSFLDAARAVAGQPDAGRKVTRTAAGLLAAADDAPPLGLVGQDGDGLAILLHGDVEFTSADETLSGRDAATWLDRLLPEVPTQWSLARVGSGAADEWSDLQAGVARGDGVATGAAAPAMAPAPMAEPEPMAEVPEPDPEPEPEPAPEPEPEAAPEPPPVAEVAPPPPPPEDVLPPPPAPAADFVSVSLLEADDEEPEREPLPVVGSDLPPPPEPDEPEVPQVHGVMCARGHFNDPSSAFCASCGISMVQQTHNLVQGPRPPLGVLVLDDGSTYVVDRDIVIGREPGSEPGVSDGSVRGITLPDPERSISRVHAKITLVEWDVQVADAGSANGTFVAGRQATEWTPVTPESPAVLTPGMHVLVGSRVLSFDTHRRG
jgi:hypothetical protein